MNIFNKKPYEEETEEEKDNLFIFGLFAILIPMILFVAVPSLRTLDFAVSATGFIAFAVFMIQQLRYDRIKKKR